MTKKQDLSAYVLVIVVQTLKKKINVFHVFLFANEFHNIASARDKARIRRGGIKVFEFVPNNIEINEVLGNVYITLIECISRKRSEKQKRLPLGNLS